MKLWPQSHKEPLYSGQKQMTEIADTSLQRTQICWTNQSFLFKFTSVQRQPLFMKVYQKVAFFVPTKTYKQNIYMIIKVKLNYDSTYKSNVHRHLIDSTSQIKMVKALTPTLRTNGVRYREVPLYVAMKSLPQGPVIFNAGYRGGVKQGGYQNILQHFHGV